VWCPIFELAALLGWRAVVRRGAAAAQGGGAIKATAPEIIMMTRQMSTLKWKTVAVSCRTASRRK
jgi:hypothetical protein